LDGRPHFTTAVERLIADLVDGLDTLSPLQASDILVVAASAHGQVSASIRSLDPVAESVRVQGCRRRVELALRPIFFLDGDVQTRLCTLIHELLHLDPEKPGALLESRRHQNLSHADLEAQAIALAEAFIARGALSNLMPLGHQGEVLMRHWKVRPVKKTARRPFDDDDVFVAPIPMKTPAGRRTGWW
jgi:hypothetical protein